MSRQPPPPRRGIQSGNPGRRPREHRRPGELTPSAATARSLVGRGGSGVVSKEGKSAASWLLDSTRQVRRQVLADLSDAERKVVFVETQRITGSLWGQWYDDPSGFAEDVIGETTWDLQQQVMDSVALPHVTRVAVPAGFGVGKTFLAGRMVAWAGAVNPIGTMKIVTTATRMRQVRSQLWPHIKTAIAKAGLPGRTDTIQWVAPDLYGNDVQVAYGFSAAPNDEAAMQGIHGTPKLLLVVDEAGGIAPLIGRGTNNLLTGDAKLLAIGNPAMNDPGSWFESLVDEGESEEERATISIRIAATDSPAITGEPTPICRACVPNYDGHTIAGGVPSHLPDWDWLHRTLREYGLIVPRDATLEDVIAAGKSGDVHPYLTAKVFARFPQDAGNKVIPASWIELARSGDDPQGEGYVRPVDLGLEGEHETFTVKRGAWVRLGIDVAAAGGDELTIYRAVGDVVSQRHASSGKQNADAMKVAERALEHVKAAERFAKAIGSRHKVRVKIDVIGLGWGVYGNLKRWGDIGRHGAEIVPVNVSEAPHAEDEAAPMRPYKKRDQMWLAGRHLLQPDPGTGNARLRLRIDPQCATQLSNPNLGYMSASGLVQIESKQAMKDRGVSSPDRAEGALLSVFEPQPVQRKKRRGLIGG